MEMKFAKNVEHAFLDCINFAKERMNEIVTPEHLLYVLCDDAEFSIAFASVGGSIELLKKDLEKYLNDNLEEENLEDDNNPSFSYGLNEIIAMAGLKAASSERDTIELIHIIDAIMNLQDSYAAYYIFSQEIDHVQLLHAMLDNDYTEFNQSSNILENSGSGEESWKQYVTCINDNLEDTMPLIGRVKELERTIQILCRKYKNNPIHIGEAGVGKTAIIYGLASLIEENNVPDVIKNSKIFSVDLGSLLAGTQYRGDFEKRLKAVLNGVLQYKNPIIYIDEIHNIVGAGSINEGSLDVSNILKPYLTEGEIRFIGATTYEEYNKFLSKSKSLLRRFQTIDIKEPSEQESIEILEGLKPYYEEYHNVKFQKGTIEHAVILSSKFIKDRFLPDKAIDLIDEAGSYRVMNPTNKSIQTVDKKLIEEVLSKICNIPKQTVESDELKKLGRLEKNLKEKIFGQDEAISEVVNAIKMSRAGLNEDSKPVANLLFVGPTGVGKTEIAKSLASVLNLKLIRFDMSEYVEKHSVAKLIGAPAGYVGYDEGGILTDEVKKNPHCILLLDEIEKAHPDIFNILLQVMDYATLTDNKGRKTDFRNATIIMTSNAGARNVGKTLIGFGKREITRESINEEVKKVFTPEFRNRLSKVVVFNNLDENMAKRIVNKKIKELNDKLKDKNIDIVPTKECIKYIVNKGTSIEYGAREIGRIIDTEVKSLLVDEILFGKLKKGGKCKIDILEEKIILK